MIICLVLALGVWRDGVKDVAYHGSAGYSGGKGVALPHVELTGYDGVPWARMVVEGGTCPGDKVLLGYDVRDADDCAQLCYNMLSCKYFEYNKQNGTCNYISLSSFPTRCASYTFNGTDTYAMVLPGTPVTYNSESIAFTCDCHFTESKTYASYQHDAFPQIPSEASGDWGLFDRFAIDLSTRDTAINTVTAPHARYATLFSRMPHVTALVLSDGAIQFEASRYLGDACLCPPGTVSWDTPYDFSFSRVGDHITIMINGEATLCQHVLHHQLKLTPVSLSMAFASIPSAWQAIENPFVTCKDSYVLVVSQGEDVSRDDCGARCAVTSLCKYFLWEEDADRTYITNANSHVQTCTLYSSCALLNATLDAEGALAGNATYNGTGALYAMDPRYQGDVDGGASLSIATAASVCMRSASASNTPAVGDFLYGSACHTDSSLPLPSQMFRYNNGTVRVHASDDLCVSYDAAMHLVLVNCLNSAYFTRHSDSTYRLASDTSLCIEIELHELAALKPCSGSYQNQTLTFAEHMSRLTTYHFTDTSGMNNWVVLGGTAYHSYESTARGIAPYPKNDGGAHDTIVIRSPVFCDPSSVSFKVSGGSSASMPRDPGYLGILLRDIATNAIVNSHTLDTFYSAVQTVTWTDATMPSACYSLELYDDSASYLVLQDVLVLSAGSPYCNEITGIRVRNPRGGATLHLKEVEVRGAAGWRVTTTARASSSLYEETLQYLTDSDVATESNYHETVNATVAEWVQLEFPKTVVAEVVLHVAIYGRTCANKAACLRESSGLLVELLSEGSVVQQYTSLDASEGNATQTVCGYGKHNTSYTALAPLNCADGLYDTSHPCSITSHDQQTTAPYAKLDLGTRQAVSRVGFYVNVDNTTDPQYEVWVGDDGRGARVGNTLCYPGSHMHGNDTLAFELRGNVSATTRFEVSCRQMGRYVYVVKPEAMSFEIYEVQAYSDPSALVAVESPGLSVSAFARLPHLTRDDALGDWSQVACTMVPVKSISVRAMSCTVDLRVSFSTVPNPSNETRYQDRNSTALPDEFSFVVSLSTMHGTILVDNVDEGVTLKGSTCTTVGIPWVLSRDGDVITVSYDGANRTLSRKYGGELYGCVLPRDDQTVWYEVETCGDDLLACGSISKYATPIAVGGSADQNHTEGSMTATLQDVRITTRFAVPSRVSVSQTLNRPAGGNITFLNTCHDDYVFAFGRADAAHAATSVLLEFNTTQTVWVKVFVDHEGVPAWLTEHGWSAIPRSTVRSQSLGINNVLTTRAVYVKRFEANELVELSGLGTATSDKTAAPYVVCVSTELDVPLDTARYLTVYESFDGALGRCSRPTVRNVAEGYRSASSVVVGTPGYGLHRGRLDSLRAWKAEHGGMPGDWYQIDIEGQVSLVKAVVTQGHEETTVYYSEWVTSYTLNYSTDGTAWYPVDGGRAWDANYDYKTKVTNTFASPIWARYIRVIPLRWHRSMALRMGVVTCEADMTTHTGLSLNITGSCIAEQDYADKVEGKASLRLRSGYALLACDEAIVSSTLTSIVTPVEIVIWGKVRNAGKQGAWVFTLVGTAYSGTSEVDFSTGCGDTFFAGDAAHSAGGFEDDVWFCLTVRFLQKNGRVQGLLWALTGSAATGFSAQGKARGLLIVDWHLAIKEYKMSKRVPEADAWFDALQVFTDSTAAGTLAFSFDSADDIAPDSRCNEYVGYNVTETGDFSLHRLTGVDLPYLSHAHCVERCCTLLWCTGVALKYSNDTLFASRGCRLMRRAFFSVEPDHRQEFYNNWAWQFQLKYAVVSLAGTSAPVLEVNEHEMRALSGVPSLVLNYTLHFRGALLDLSTAVVKVALTSSVPSTQEARGFSSLKDLVLPDSAVDVASYPPLVTVSLYSTPNYHVAGDEVLSWSYFNEALKVTNTSSRGGGVVGAMDLPVVKLRGAGSCDGTTACNKRPCICTSLECQRAYICGCCAPTVPIPQAAAAGFRQGDVVYVVHDAQYVRHQQEAHSRWLSPMLDFVGTQGTVTSVSGLGELGVTFRTGEQYTFHNSTVLRTSGVDVCTFHRRPSDWPFDYPAPPVYT